MVSNPLYRLLDFGIGPQALRATVTTSDFAAYALILPTCSESL